MLAGLAIALATLGVNAPVRGCAERADSNSANPAESPRPEDMFVARRLLLVALQAPKTWETDGATPGWKWFKSLAVVRRGRRVTLTIPRSQRSRVRLEYGHSRTSITFAPCADRTWTYFPGGFVYSRPGCYAVDVRIQGRDAVRKRFPLGVGARCAT